MLEIDDEFEHAEYSTKTAVLVRRGNMYIETESPKSLMKKGKKGLK